MKLNLGCGDKILTGYCNVDKYGEPDIIWDLEVFPWPWPDDSVDEVILNHVLEHLGQVPNVFLGVMKELYRVCVNGALIHIAVPHPRHDHFFMDPTHVRPITIDLFTMFSKKNNLAWRDAGAANTPLALLYGVDFEIKSTSYSLEEPYNTQYRNKEISIEQITEMLKLYNNVAFEIRMEITAIK